MMITMFLVSGIVHFAAPVSSAATVGELNGEKLAFAYMDGTGKQLLGFDSNKPNRFIKAIYAPGKALNVKYVKHQNRTDKDNGRQNEWNFDQDEGELFNVAQGKIAGNESVLLVEKGAFQGHEFLKYKPISTGAFAKSVIGKMEKEKKRKVVNQGLIGQVSADVQIGIVEFEKTAGKKPLASLVMTTKSGLIFEDFVGINDDQSTWRVDDGGMITPDMLKIIFVTQSKAGYSLGFEWSGAEGYSLKIVQQKGVEFRSVLESSRYTAPV
jgi:hypothetical protein